MTEVLVRLAGELLVAPDEYLRCVARTKTGRRCANGADLRAETAEHVNLIWTGGHALALGIRDPAAAEVQRWREQHCPIHDTPDSADHTAPEWRAFDPTTHTDLVRPLTPWPPLPKTPTPVQDWCPPWLTW